MPLPILLIAPEAIALPVAEALRSHLHKPVDIAATRRDGLFSVRRGEYTIVLLDEGLAAADPDCADLIYQSAGAAPVLELNFAISTADRIVRQTRSALQRRAQDQAQARAAAAAHMQGELGASLTGLLLESQLALRTATPELAPKLRNVVQMAGDLRNLLRA